MNTTISKNLYDSITTHNFTNGLKMIVIDKSYNIQNITIGINFGSLDNITYNLPMGTAHLMEHLIFEKEDKDFLFSDIKKSINATTHLSKTTFSLNTEKDIIPILLKMLSFLITFSFTEDSLSIEKMIVKDEISIYETNFMMNAQLQILSDIYSNTNIKKCISGDSDDLQMITLKFIKECFTQFYHFSNMTIVLSTNTSPKDIINELEKFFNDNKLILENKLFNVKNVTYFPSYNKISFYYQNNYLFIGMDLNSYKNNSLYQLLDVKIALDSLFGSKGIGRKKLFDENIISKFSNIDINCEKYFSYAMFYVKTQHPQKTIEKFIEIIQNINKLISTKNIEVSKRKISHSLILCMDNIEWLNYQLYEKSLYNNNFIHMLELIRQVKEDDIYRLGFNRFKYSTYYLKGDASL